MSKSMEELKRMICKEIDEIADKGEMSPGDLDVINKLVVTKEKLLRIEELEDDLGYSEGGDWRAEGSYMGDSYGRGNSYNMRGGAYRNSYARRRDSRGRYSRDGGSMRDKMMDMLNTGDFTSSQRQAIQNLMDEM